MKKWRKASVKELDVMEWHNCDKENENKNRNMDIKDKSMKDTRKREKIF